MSFSQISFLQTLFGPEVFAAALRVMIPLLLAALGGLLTKQAGIENIGLEGLMLIGCFSGFVVNYYTSNWIAGLIGGAVFTTLAALLFGVFVISLRAHEIVAGVAVNMLGLGVTTYLLRAIFGVKGSFTDPRIRGIPTLELGFLENVPVVGVIFSRQSIMVWIGLALVIAIHFLLYHARFGYYIRAAGENPQALSTSGISLPRTRYITVLIHGVLCGLGGAYLSTGYLTQYVENMSAGRGFIAMAAIAFGGAKPMRVFFSAILFAFVESLSNRLQLVEVPSYFALMIPYVVTVIVLAVTSWREKQKSKTSTL
ncbi:MAG: ABC transporter permease [Peptococcaceae bacterium]|jgi:simple sugar transport system permease protein|nr:ABC transporter permease [Peptococcaceae bacterium]